MYCLFTGRASMHWAVNNTSDVPLQIKKILFAPGCSDERPVEGATVQTLNGAAILCTTSTILPPQPTQYCQIEVFCSLF